MDVFKIFGTIFIKSEEAVEKLQDIKEKAKSTGEGFENVDKKAKQLSNGGFSVLKGAAANLISSGFQRLISAMGQFISSGADYQMQIEQYATSFATMTGSEEKAAEMTAKLGEIAASTPFEMPTLADATQLLMNYGFTADGAIEKMMMLGDIAQGQPDKMNRIAMAYGQMSSAGKVTLEDVKQMIEAGFNPLQEISEATGESMESLYDRISKGTISVDEITASMERSTSEGGKYFGAMNAQSKTFTGRLSTLKDAANESIGNILAPLLQRAADDWFPRLTEAIEQVDEKFAEFGAWVEEHSGILTALGVVIGVITAALTAQAAVTAITTAMEAAHAASLGALITMKYADAAASLAALAPYLLIAAAIAALIAVIVLCVKHWDEIKAKVVEVATAIGEWVTSMVAAVIEKFEAMKAAVAEKIATIVANVTSKFQEIRSTISSKLNEAKSTVENVFDNIKQSITDKIEAARDAVEDAIDKIKGFFDFEWKLPDIKLPHFTKTGETALGLPIIDVEWYAKGGILNKPTIFGMNGNNAMIGGEAGAEAVAPIDVLQGYVAAAVASQNAGVVEALDRVALILSEIRDSMGDDLKNQLENTSLTINHREFGRLVRGVI